MPKSVIVLAVPGVLAALSMLGGPAGPDASPGATADLRLVEVGVAWEERVREALPGELEPLEGPDGVTGGIALYDSPGGGGAAGYAWVDVAYGPGARYVLRAFADVGAGPGVAPPPGGDGVRVTAAGAPGRLLVLVEPVCRAEPVALARHLFASGEDGRLAVLPGPMARGWCRARVAAAVPAVPGAPDPGGPVGLPGPDLLGGLAPERVLWAGVATPLGPAPRLPEAPRAAPALH